MSVRCEDGTLYRYEGWRHPNDPDGGGADVGKCEHCRPTNHDGVGCDLLEELDAIRDRHLCHKLALADGVVGEAAWRNPSRAEAQQAADDMATLLAIVARAFAKPRPERVITPLPVDHDAIPF